MKETGIHAILGKICEDADQHSSELYLKIKDETDKEIESENAFYHEEMAKRREILTNHNENEYGLLHDRLSSRFNRELLIYRHKLIDDIFDMAAKKLRNVSKNEFAGMFADAVRGLKGDYVLYAGELTKDKLGAQDVKRAMKENDGLTITLSPETIPQKSGFLLKDDRVEYNSLFEDLIDNKRNEQASLIMNEVFGDLL